jgi:hypothetical protein
LLSMDVEGAFLDWYWANGESGSNIESDVIIRHFPLHSTTSISTFSLPLAISSQSRSLAYTRGIANFANGIWRRCSSQNLRWQSKVSTKDAQINLSVWYSEHLILKTLHRAATLLKRRLKRRLGLRRNPRQMPARARIPIQQS